MIDFQAHGESPGEAITIGYREKHDVVAAVGYARETFKGLPVVVVGVSMGGAAAVLASPLGVDALVLESVYPDIRTAVQNRVRKRLGAAYWLPSELLLLQLGPRLGIGLGHLRPIDRIAEAECPVLIISGAEDLHTTVADTKAIFQEASAPKELWLVDGAGHVDLHKAAGEQYERRVIEFLDKIINARGANGSEPVVGADVFQFPVPIDDAGSATLNKEERAFLLMRYIREYSKRTQAAKDEQYEHRPDDA